MVSKVIGMNVQGFDMLEKNLRKRLRRNLRPELKKTLEESALDLSMVAQELAPYDTGALENAISVSPSRRDFGWAFRYEVWANPRIMNPKAKYRVGVYAEEAHERIEPIGDWHLGPGSEAKDQSIGSKYGSVGGVGGGFMDRAYEYCKPFIEANISTAVRNALAKR